MTLPTFYIIGAPRCGTTSLHAHCTQHPDIYMSHFKEPNYLIFRDGGPDVGGPDRDRVLRTSIRDMAAYEKRFAPGRGFAAVGEASVNYLRYPHVCEALRALTPEARMVVILRHPVERAYSSFRRSRRDGFEPLESFEEAWYDARRRNENWWTCQHRLKSEYGSQLRAYLEAFPRHQFRFFLFDDLRRDPTGLLRELFGFIGDDPAFVPDTSVKYNSSGEITNPLLRTLWYRSRGARTRLAPFVPVALRGRLFPLIASKREGANETTSLDPDLRYRLTRDIEDEILLTQDLIDRDLSHWLAD